MSLTTSSTAARSRPAPSLPGRRLRWVALIVLSLAQLMDVLDGTIINIALPTAQRELGFSADARAWVVSGYALAYGSLLLLAGRLADRFGRKRLFIIGVTGFAVASAVGGAAGSFEVLLAARVAQGCFAAVLAPAALSLVSVTFASNSKERARAFSIFGAVSGGGGVVGLILGGVLTDVASWRWCLYINIVIAAVALVGAVLVVRDQSSTGRRVPLDALGAALIVAALFGIVFGLSDAADHGWSDLRTWMPIAAGGVLLVLFVLRQATAAHPLLPLHVVLERDRGAAFLAIAAVGVGAFAAFLYLTYYLQRQLAFTPLASGIAFLPMIAALVAAAGLSGALLLPRFGPRPLVPAGLVLAAVAMALLTQIGGGSDYASHVLPSELLLGAGFGLVFGSAQNVATSRLRPEDNGVASALVSTAQQVGGSIGLAVFTSLAAAATKGYVEAHGRSAVTAAGRVDATLFSDQVVFWTAAGVFLLAAVLTAALFRSGPTPVTPGDDDASSPATDEEDHA